MTFGSLYGLFIAGWLWSASHKGIPAVTILAHLGIGLLGWTFIEYLLHRWVFHRHWQPVSLHTLQQSWHLNHHTAPDNPAFLHAQLYTSLPLYAFFYAAFYVCTDLWRAGLLVSGLTVGYLYYELVHHLAHTRAPRSRLGRALKRYHLIHHYAEPDRAYGVTSPLWDIIFGTSPRRRAPLISARDQNRLLTGQS